MLCLTLFILPALTRTLLQSNLKLAGAIAQCPYTGVFPRFTLGLLLAIFLALWDLFRRALGGAPVYIRAAAPPGHAGAMTVQGSVEGMGALCGYADSS